MVRCGLVAKSPLPCGIAAMRARQRCARVAAFAIQYDDVQYDDVQDMPCGGCCLTVMMKTAGLPRCAPAFGVVGEAHSQARAVVVTHAFEGVVCNAPYARVLRQ